MSASPRKLLRRALDALRQLDDVRARYPDAERELAEALGADHLRALDAARDEIARAVERIEATRGESS